MKKRFYTFSAAGFLLIIISLSIMGCKARMPGPDDDQGTSPTPAKVQKITTDNTKK